MALVLNNYNRRRLDILILARLSYTYVYIFVFLYAYIRVLISQGSTSMIHYIMSVWVMRQRNLVDGYQSFGQTFRVQM